MRNVPWARVVVESMAIVASILLAFAIDAWWAGRQDRLVEAAHLRALDSDLTEALRQQDGRDAVLAEIRPKLVRLLEEDLTEQPRDSIAQWAEGLWQLGTYSPVVAALDDLEASGQLRLLTGEVRRQVSTLRRALGRAESSQDNLRSLQETHLDPFLVEHLPIGAAIASDLGLPSLATIPETDEWSALGTSEARNRLVIKLTALQGLSQARATLRHEMQALQLVVEERIAQLD